MVSLVNFISSGFSTAKAGNPITDNKAASTSCKKNNKWNVERKSNLKKS